MENSEDNSTPATEKSFYNILEYLINSIGLDLVIKGHAEFVYSGEGNNNIVVIFKILDYSCTEPDMANLIEYFDNKVLRIKKKVSSKYTDNSVIPELETYMKYVFEHIALKDPELHKFTIISHEIKLTFDTIRTINEHIQHKRNLMIEEAHKNYPLKTFQGIDTDLREALVMPSLSSQFCKWENGEVKHVELKVGLITPKPLQNSFIEYMKNTYDADQIDKSGILVSNISRFTTKQVSLYVKGKLDVICKFDPYAMLSDDLDKMKASLLELFKTGAGYAKIFSTGVLYEITNYDIDELAKILTRSGIFSLLAKYQSLENSPLDEINRLYVELTKNSEDEHYKYVEFYFQNFYKRKILNDYECEVCPIQLKWDQILDWTVAETFKDSSIMIKWIQNGEDMNLIDLKIIDIDTKLWTKLPDYDKEMFEFFKDYAKFMINLDENRK